MSERTIESVVIPWGTAWSLVMVGSVIEYSRYAFKAGWCEAVIPGPAYWMIQHVNDDPHGAMHRYRKQLRGQETLFLDPIMYYAQRPFQILYDTSLADFLLIPFAGGEQASMLHELANRYAAKLGPRGVQPIHFIEAVKPALAQRLEDLALDRDS